MKLRTSVVGQTFRASGTLLFESIYGFGWIRHCQKFTTLRIEKICLKQKEGEIRVEINRKRLRCRGKAACLKQLSGEAFTPAWQRPNSFRQPFELCTWRRHVSRPFNTLNGSWRYISAATIEKKFQLLTRAAIIKMVMTAAAQLISD